MKQLPRFLRNLYNVVNESSTDNLIHWSSDGLSFIIENREEFTTTVLPLFFGITKFSSFHRELNSYVYKFMYLYCS